MTGLHRNKPAGKVYGRYLSKKYNQINVWTLTLLSVYLLVHRLLFSNRKKWSSKSWYWLWLW